MSSRRDQIVKVRFSDAEMDQIDSRRRNLGTENCAGYIRRRAQEAELRFGIIAEMVGRVGFTLTALDADPQRLEQLTRSLDTLTEELRKLQGS